MPLASNLFKVTLMKQRGSASPWQPFAAYTLPVNWHCQPPSPQVPRLSSHPVPSDRELFRGLRVKEWQKSRFWATVSKAQVAIKTLFCSDSLRPTRASLPTRPTQQLHPPKTVLRFSPSRKTPGQKMVSNACLRAAFMVKVSVHELRFQELIKYCLL